MSSPRCRSLPTERPNPASRGLDKLATPAVVRLINAEDRRVPAAVGAEASRIARAAEMIAETLSAGGRLLFAGAGTSGRLGVLEAAECPPTFGTPLWRVGALMAGGPRAVFRSKEGAEDDSRAGARAFRAWRARRKGPAVVVGIAASGVTPFVRGVLSAARAAGCRTVVVTSNPGPGAVRADLVIAPRVGPEVLAGSTRMKSATAAKLVLNTLTTAAMVRWGRVYDRWMVDLKPSSRKLRLRALRIVGEIGRVPPGRAKALYERSGRDVKAAVLMARGARDRKDALKRLKAHGGRLRGALEAL